VTRRNQFAFSKADRKAWVDEMTERTQRRLAQTETAPKEDSMKEPGTLSDAELIALSAAAISWAVEVVAANQDRTCRGQAMAYDGIGGEYFERLHNELVARGIIAR